jgi:hypothetical protein
MHINTWEKCYDSKSWAYKRLLTIIYVYKRLKKFQTRSDQSLLIAKMPCWVALWFTQQTISSESWVRILVDSLYNRYRWRNRAQGQICAGKKGLIAWRKWPHIELTLVQLKRSI